MIKINKKINKKRKEELKRVFGEIKTVKQLKQIFSSVLKPVDFQITTKYLLMERILIRVQEIKALCSRIEI